MEKYDNNFNPENRIEDVDPVSNLDSELNQTQESLESEDIDNESTLEPSLSPEQEQNILEEKEAKLSEIRQEISNIEEPKTELEKVTQALQEQNPGLPAEWIDVREMTGGYKVNILPNSAESNANITSLNVPDNIKYLFISADFPTLTNVDANNREDFRLVINNINSSVDVSSLESSKDLVINSSNKEINLSRLREVTNSVKIMGSVGNLDLSSLTQINNLDLSNVRGSESTQIKLNPSLDQESINKFIEVFGTDNILLENKEIINEQSDSIEEKSESETPVEEPKEDLTQPEVELSEQTELEKVTQALQEQNPGLPLEWIDIREMTGGYKVNILPNSTEAKRSVTSLNVPDNVKYLFISGDLPNLNNVDANNREDFKLVINNINSSIDVSSLESSNDLVINSSNKEINLSGLREITNSIKIMGAVGNLDLSNLTHINNLDLSNVRGSESTQIKLNSNLDQESINKFIEVFGTENVLIDNKENIGQTDSIEETSEKEEVLEEPKTELERVNQEFHKKNPNLPKEWIDVREMTGGYKVNILPNSAESKGAINTLNVPDDVKYLFVSGDLPNLTNVDANNREDFKLVINNINSSIDVSSLATSKDMIVNCTNKEVNLSGLREITNSIKIMGSVGNLDLSNLTQISKLDLVNARGNESTQIKLNSNLDQESINKFIEVFGTENVLVG